MITGQFTKLYIRDAMYLSDQDRFDGEVTILVRSGRGMQEVTYPVRLRKGGKSMEGDFNVTLPIELEGVLTAKELLGITKHYVLGLVGRKGMVIRIDDASRDIELSDLDFQVTQSFTVTH